MSEEKNITADNKIIIKTKNAPILVKKENKIKFLRGEGSNLLIKNFKFGPGNSLLKQNVIFESKPGDLIRDSPVKITIINHFNLLKNTTRTVITYYDQLNGRVLSEKNSDQITKFIGHNNYETVISALCTVSDEEVKIKAIMALLTKESFEEQSTQTETDEKLDVSKLGIKNELSAIVEKSCQTDENCMDLIYKLKQRKRVKRSVLTPYVVKDSPEKVIKKVVVNPNKLQHRKIIKEMDKKQKSPNSTTTKQFNAKVEIKVDEEQNNLPHLSGLHFSEESNDTNPTLSGSLCGDNFLDSDKIQTMIGEHTTNERSMHITEVPIVTTEVPIVTTEVPIGNHFIRLPDGVSIQVPVKPEFPFHIATPGILRHLKHEDRMKVISYQAYLDFKMCLTTDADGYLPIHLAVMNNDVDLLRRQCVVLKYRQQSLDITAGNLTPLQMSIFQDSPLCTAMLLQNGADPLLTDEEHRTCLHLASESTSDHLRAVIHYCENNAREILQDNEELWKTDYENKSKEILGAILMKHMCEMSDSQGYTPLMLAAKSGNYIAVMMLMEASPDCINLQMPNSGSTALFLAVEGACHDASNRGNKSKVADHFNRTISILLENGADISISNHSGTTINDVLADNNNAELSTIFANKVTSKYFDGNLPGGTKFDSFMLLKNKEGRVGITEVKQIKTDKDDKNVSVFLNNKNTETQINKKVSTNKKDKLVILENIALPQSKVILDPNSLFSPQNRKINPNDKLIAKNNATTSKMTTKVVKNIVNDEKMTSQDGGIIIQKTLSLKNNSKNFISETKLTIQQGKETLKRKSTNGNGPNEKKTKSKSLIT